MGQNSENLEIPFIRSGFHTVWLDRSQGSLFPECLDDWIDENNPVRVIDAFVDGVDLAELGFDGVEAAATGRPSYHPSALLKLYIYGYLNRVQSSRRLEREAGRNVEVMWLTGLLSLITKRLLISEGTMAAPFAKSARNSSRFVVSWGCCRQAVSQSMAASSRP